LGDGAGSVVAWIRCSSWAGLLSLLVLVRLPVTSVEEIRFRITSAKIWSVSLMNVNLMVIAKRTILHVVQFPVRLHGDSRILNKFSAFLHLQ
jgi:hypothetical protein